ncbi:MAG: hypothetical protein H6737_14240 [Alphaproteobacteria bacterium]|nr:hypothetical protein [Alphaproteobacteria bacterium]
MTLLTLLTLSANAQDKEPYDHHVSLTTSPLQLILPIFEVTAEFRLADRIGLGAIGGIGASGGIPVGTFGPTFRFYPVGSFDHGMQVGADLQLVAAATEFDGVIYSAAGVSGGPFVGYKIAARFGLTFEGQLGVGGSFVSGGGQTSVGPIPILNLNLGWSF